MVHRTNAIHVMVSSWITRKIQSAMEIKGIAGTAGTLKALGISGCILRSTITVTYTKKNAHSVPILQSSAIVPIGKTPARITPMIQTQATA